MVKFLVILALLFPSVMFAQNLPGGFTCQDLIDTAEGKLSRSTDGGKTFVPIRRPQGGDALGAALLTHDTQLCYRLTRGEITATQFNALHDEKAQQIRSERERAFLQRQQLENQQQAIRNQQAAIQAQREAINVQRQAATIQALQAEAARQQAEAQHQERLQQQQLQHQEWLRQQQIQQQQLEQIRREQARPKSFSCIGGGGAIYCN